MESIETNEFIPKEKLRNTIIDEEIEDEDFTKHTSNFCTLYLDFDSYSDDYLSFLEFNLDDHGYYILQNHYSGIECIKEEFDYITEFTSNK